MASYLITGTSRGIGLGLVTRLLKQPESKVKFVFATARDPKRNDKLVSLANSPEGRGRVMLLTLDVCNEASVNNAASIVSKTIGSEGGLDILINNAAILPEIAGIVEMTDENLLKAFKTNVMGVQRVIRAFLPLMRRGEQKKIVNIGARLSSLSRSTTSPILPVSAYAISKTALNMVNMQWAKYLKDDNFIVSLLCPGWVQTDMGSMADRQADLTIEVAVKAILERVDALDLDSNGKFLKTHVPGWEDSEFMQYDGSEVQW